jgi:hypothetical protein
MYICNHTEVKEENGYPRCQKCGQYQDPVKGWIPRHPESCSRTEKFTPIPLLPELNHADYVFPNMSNTSRAKAMRWDPIKNLWIEA